jgi:hypothetical protein
MVTVLYGDPKAAASYFHSIFPVLVEVKKGGWTPSPGEMLIWTTKFMNI